MPTLAQPSSKTSASPWKLGGLTSKQLLLKTWNSVLADDVLGRAGQLAYFFFFAVFPLIVFVSSMIGVVAGPNSTFVNSLMDYVTRAMPPAAAQLVGETMKEALNASGGGKITFGLAVTLLSASSGMTAMMDTLNVAFGVKEGRPLWKQYAIAASLTVAVGIFISLAVFIVVGGGNMVSQLSSSAKGGWQIAQYPIALAFLLLSYSVIYYFAPNVEHPQWH